MSASSEVAVVDAAPEPGRGLLLSLLPPEVLAASARAGLLRPPLLLSPPAFRRLLAADAATVADLVPLLPSGALPALYGDARVEVGDALCAHPLLPSDRVAEMLGRAPSPRRSSSLLVNLMSRVPVEGPLLRSVVPSLPEAVVLEALSRAGAVSLVAVLPELVSVLPRPPLMMFDDALAASAPRGGPAPAPEGFRRLVSAALALPGEVLPSRVRGLRSHPALIPPLVAALVGASSDAAVARRLASEPALAEDVLIPVREAVSLCLLLADPSALPPSSVRLPDGWFGRLVSAAESSRRPLPVSVGLLRLLEASGRLEVGELSPVRDGRVALLPALSDVPGALQVGPVASELLLRLPAGRIPPGVFVRMLQSLDLADPDPDPQHLRLVAAAMSDPAVRSEVVSAAAAGRLRRHSAVLVSLRGPLPPGLLFEVGSSLRDARPQSVGGLLRRLDPPGRVELLSGVASWAAGLDRLRVPPVVTEVSAAVASDALSDPSALLGFVAGCADAVRLRHLLLLSPLFLPSGLLPLIFGPSSPSPVMTSEFLLRLVRDLFRADRGCPVALRLASEVLPVRDLLSLPAPEGPDVRSAVLRPLLPPSPDVWELFSAAAVSSTLSASALARSVRLLAPVRAGSAADDAGQLGDGVEVELPVDAVGDGA